MLTWGGLGAQLLKLINSRVFSMYGRARGGGAVWCDVCSGLMASSMHEGTSGQRRGELALYSVCQVEFSPSS